MLLELLLLGSAIQGVEATASCPVPLRLEVTRRPLGEVLHSLAEQQGFALDVRIDANETVTGVYAGSAGDVLRELFRYKGVVIEEMPMEACPGQLRVRKVWLLQQGEEGVQIRYQPQATAPENAAIAPKPVPAQLREDHERQAFSGWSEAEREAFRLERKQAGKEQREALEEKKRGRKAGD